MAKQLGNQEIIGDGSNPSLVIDTTAFIVTETGNVGIGTNVPNTKLHTFGQISADKNSGDTAIVDTSIPFYAIRQNTGAPDYYSGLQFAFEVGGGIWGTAYDYASNYYQLLGVSNTKFGFGYGNSNSATYSMTIDNSNGNVGIGNNTPAYKLHVVGTTRFSGSSVFGAPASDIIANKINLDLAYKIAFDGLDALYYDLATDATVLKGGANNIIKFMGTIELARFAEDSAPYFSIGSTDMLATVYVKSAGAGTALRVDGNSIASILTVADNGRIGILNDTPSYDFDSNAATNTFRNRVLVDYIQSVYFPNTSGTTTQITLGSNVTVMSRGELGVAYDTFIVNTPTTLTTTGANLLAVYNNSVGRLIVSKDGDTYIAGNTGIGLDTFGAKLHVKSSSGIAFRVDGPSVNNILQVLQDANGYGSTYTANSKALFDATDWYPSVYGRNTVTNRLFVAQGNPTIPSYSTMVGTWHTSMFDSAIFAYSSSNNYMTLATSSHTSTTGIIMGDDNESLAMSLSKRGNAYVGNFAGSSITQASAAIWGDYYGKQIITGSVGQEIYFLNPTDSYYSYHFNGFGLLMDNKATIHNTAAAMIHLKLRQYPPAGYQSRIMRLENLTDYSSISLPETQAPLFEIINNPTEPGTPSNLTGNIFQINDMINSYYNLIRVEKNGSLRMKLDKDGKMLLSDADYQGTYDISCGGSVISKARLMVDSALDGYSTIMLQGKGGLGGNAGENAIYLGDSYKAFAAIKSSTQSPFKEGNIDFYTTPDNTATGLQKRMTINKDGFVGIGTTVTKL